MISKVSTDSGVSPVIAVILVVAITVVLSSVVGILVLDIGQGSLSDTDTNRVGLTTTASNGIVEINSKVGNADSVRVLVNGEEASVTESFSPGDKISVYGVESGSDVVVVSGTNDSGTVIDTIKTTDPVPSKNVTLDPDGDGTTQTVTLKGSGTVEYPYVIETVEQLQAMDLEPSAHYVLGRNVDASGTQSWNGGSGFKPIGSSDFTGSLDGNGLHINKLYINRNTDKVGLFKEGDESKVSDIQLKSVTIVGKEYTGSIFGMGNEVEISNVEVTGTVTGTDNTGGLIGIEVFSGGLITDSNTDITTEGSGQIGGLVGFTFGSIDNSYATGYTSGTEEVGGVAGKAFFESITDSYATGNVNGTNFVGGLVGNLADGQSLKRSYATGTVTSSGSYAGGLIGRVGGSGTTVSNSYATGDVQGTAYVGGFAGAKFSSEITTSYSSGSVSGDTDVSGFTNILTSGGVTNSYYDTEEANASRSSNASPLTTSDITGPSAESNMNGFDFDSVWKTTNGYPELR